MRFGAGYKRPMALACALAWLLAFSQHGVAAPRANELGPPAPLAEPSGGYVGQIKVSPAHGAVGNTKRTYPSQAGDVGSPTHERSIRLVEDQFGGKLFHSECHIHVQLVLFQSPGRPDPVVSSARSAAFINALKEPSGRRAGMRSRRRRLYVR